MHTQVRMVFPERSEVADACVPWLVACTSFLVFSGVVVTTVPEINQQDEKKTIAERELSEGTMKNPAEQ